MSRSGFVRQITDSETKTISTRNWASHYGTSNDIVRALSRLRFIHNVAYEYLGDNFYNLNIDVYLNDKLILENISYGDVGVYIRLYDGVYNIKIKPSSKQNLFDINIILINIKIELGVDKSTNSYTAILHGLTKSLITDISVSNLTDLPQVRPVIANVTIERNNTRILPQNGSTTTITRNLPQNGSTTTITRNLPQTATITRNLPRTATISRALPQNGSTTIISGTLFQNNEPRVVTSTLSRTLAPQYSSDINLLVVEDYDATPPPGKSHIRFIHVAAGLPILDLRAANDQLLLYDNVEYPSIGQYIEIDSVPTDIDLYESGYVGAIAIDKTGNRATSRIS